MEFSFRHPVAIAISKIAYGLEKDTKADLETAANYDLGMGNQSLSTVAFSNVTVPVVFDPVEPIPSKTRVLLGSM